MLFTRQEFEDTVRDKLSQSTRGDVLDNTVLGMMRDLDNVMGLERGSHVHTHHIGTLYALYDDRGKRMGEHGDKGQMLECKWRARTLEHIAEKHGSNVFVLRSHANKDVISALLDNVETGMKTTDYDKITTPYFMTMGEQAAAANDTPHTPEALIKKAAPRAIIEPRQPTQPREKIVKAEKPVEHRPIQAIRDDYSQAWGEVAQAAAAKKIMHLVTLTDTDNPAPWLSAKPEKFAQNMAATRDAAREYGVDVQRTLNRIEGLHSEYHAARNQNAAQSR